MIARFFRANSAARKSALLLAVLALLLKAIIPAGVMLDPARAGQGLSPVVMCTGHGPMTAWVDANGKLADPHHAKSAPVSDRHGERPCAFAAMAAPLNAPPAGEIVAAQSAVAMATAEPHVAARLTLRRVAAPPPQTGPPNFV
jgi:hypothetical protein